MTTEATTLAMADQLRQYAEHFVQRDWNYTRHTGIRHIRYEGDWSGYNHPLRRFARTARQFLPPRDNIAEMLDVHVWRNPIIHFRAGMRTPRHDVDGGLDNGGILTVWEEIGEYLQYVQPSVGSLIADWMEAEPDNPHAQRVAAEMKRINDAYGERIKAGDVDGDLDHCGDPTCDDEHGDER